MLHSGGENALTLLFSCQVTILFDYSDILAVNIKKADMLANIGDQYSKSIHDTVVCFDNSIAYSTANIK